MSIIEAAGLTDEEAQEFHAYQGTTIGAGALPHIRAARKLSGAIAAELEAKRPIQVGDRVRYVNSKTGLDMTVLCVDDAVAWCRYEQDGTHTEWDLIDVERVS